MSRQCWCWPFVEPFWVSDQTLRCPYLDGSADILRSADDVSPDQGTTIREGSDEGIATLDLEGGRQTPGFRRGIEHFRGGRPRLASGGVLADDDDTPVGERSDVRAVTRDAERRTPGPLTSGRIPDFDVDARA